MGHCMKKVENHWFRGMRFTSVTIARYSMHAPDIVCLLQLAVNAAATSCHLFEYHRCFVFSSVYFTGDILVATDRLELLCWQSKIGSRGMTQYQQKVSSSGKRCPARGVTVRCYSWYANGFRFNSHLAGFRFVFFQAPLRCYVQGLVLLGQGQDRVRLELGLGQLSFRLLLLLELCFLKLSLCMFGANAAALIVSAGK